MSANKNGSDIGGNRPDPNPDTERSVKEAENIMTQEYSVSKINDKSEPRISELHAAVVKVIVDEYKGKLVFGLQSAGQDMVCRYLCASISPRLYVTLILKHKEILVSLHSADDFSIPNDQVMPAYAVDLASLIRSATRNSKLVTFKQPALRNAKGG